MGETHGTRLRSPSDGGANHDDAGGRLMFDRGLPAGIARVRRQRPIDMTDDDLLTMLRAIDAGDTASGPLDSSGVARRLGWTAATTATSLSDAKASMLIWGIRVGGTSYEDLELTVQGRRLLTASRAADV
jgi:hypothetical protein